MIAIKTKKKKSNFTIHEKIKTWLFAKDRSTNR